MRAPSQKMQWRAIKGDALASVGTFFLTHTCMFIHHAHPQEIQQADSWSEMGSVESHDPVWGLGKCQPEQRVSRAKSSKE